MREDEIKGAQRLINRLPARARTPGFLRLIRYAVAGGLTFVVNIGLYALLRESLGWEVTPANIVAVLCAVVFAYLVNKWFVFKTRCPNRKELFREALSFFSARAATMLLEIGGVFLLVDLVRLHELIGLRDFWIKAALTVLVVLLNYVFSKWFVFRKA